MENKGKKILRGIISFLLSLILASSLTLLGLVWAVKEPISSSGILSSLEECRYTDEMTVRINEDFEMLCQTSGVPAELVSAFLAEEVTEENMLFPLYQMLGQEAEAVSPEELKARLTSRIEAYAVSLREKGELEVTEEEWAEIVAGFPQLSAFFVAEITSAINLRGLYSTMGAALSFVGRLLPYVAWALLPILLASAGMLGLIWKRKGLYFGYLTATSASLLLLVPSFYLKMGDFVMRLGLEPLYLKLFLNSIVSHLCNRMMIAGGVLLAMGILCGVSTILLKAKEKKESQTERKCEHDS